MQQPYGCIRRSGNSNSHQVMAILEQKQEVVKRVEQPPRESDLYDCFSSSSLRLHTLFICMASEHGFTCRMSSSDSGTFQAWFADPWEWSRCKMIQ
eukprot:1653588-Amphidinium_carterae.1